jgi:hypothetical protein
MLFVALPGGMLFMELTKVEDNWLWCSCMIGNKPKLGLSYFGRLAVGKGKCKMESIVGGGEPIAWCG